jgi:hypothetical protein
MGKRPCCCIPNRAGTIILSLLSIIISTLFLVATFAIIATNALNTPAIVPAVIWGFSNLLLFVSSWVGFFGAVLRKRRAVAFYAVILMILWVSTLVLGVWNIVVIFKNRQMAIDGCVAKGLVQAHGAPYDSNTSKGQCTKAHNVLAGIFVSAWVVYQLLSLWFISVVFALRREYIERSMLEKQAINSTYSVNPMGGPGSVYSRSSEDSKMSSRSGTVVSVPYRPSAGPNRAAPMGGYVSSGVPVGGGATSTSNIIINKGGSAAAGSTGSLSRSDRSSADAGRGTVNNSVRKSPPPLSLQKKRSSFGPPNLNVTIEQDVDWGHEATPASAYHDVPLSAQPGSIFQSRYDQRYG